jgi:hypothetical protein
MALTVSIQLLSLESVEIDRVRPGNRVEDKRNAHSLPCADVVCDVSEYNGTDGATTDGGDEEGGTALSVATETAECECEDWEVG